MGNVAAKLGRTNFGIFALALSAAINVPFLCFEIMPGFGIRPPERMMNNLGNLIFDFGFIIEPLIFALSVFGLVQSRRNRIAAVVALLLLLLPWIL